MLRLSHETLFLGFIKSSNKCATFCRTWSLQTDQKKVTRWGQGHLPASSATVIPIGNTTLVRSNS